MTPKKIVRFAMLLGLFSCSASSNISLTESTTLLSYETPGERTYFYLKKPSSFFLYTRDSQVYHAGCGTFEQKGNKLTLLFNGSHSLRDTLVEEQFKGMRQGNYMFTVIRNELDKQPLKRCYIGLCYADSGSVGGGFTDENGEIQIAHFQDPYSKVKSGIKIEEVKQLTEAEANTIDTTKFRILEVRFPGKPTSYIAFPRKADWHKEIVNPVHTRKPAYIQAEYAGQVKRFKLPIDTNNSERRFTLYYDPQLKPLRGTVEWRVKRKLMNGYEVETQAGVRPFTVTFEKESPICTLP